MNTQQNAQDLAPHIPVKVLGMNTLQTAAYRDFKRLDGGAPAHIVGVIVNFIRHKLTPYDKLMTATRKHKNGEQMREVLAAATLTAIAQAYAHQPEIVAEARRQLAKKNAEPKIRAWRAN